MSLAEHTRRTFLATSVKLSAMAALGWNMQLLAASPVDIKSLLDTSLRAEHPRLHRNKAQWEELRRSIEQDPLLKKWHDAIQVEAERIYRQPLVVYKLDGPRLLARSREALYRISTLAGLYRLDGDKKKADRAREELKAVCAFSDWHPPHFLDVAEMTNAVALGYDWLYEVLSEEERANIRKAIVNFGLKPGLNEFARGAFWTKLGANNWGQVCCGGLTTGALAIAHDGAQDPGGEPKEILDILKLTTSRVHFAMDGYAPDGGWPEGPGYWVYATDYNCMMLSALESALGTELGLSEARGFSVTGEFRMATIGPTGLKFNYADGKDPDSPASAMFWMAKHFNKMSYAVDEQLQISRTGPEIFHLVWSVPNESKLPPNSLPLDVTYSTIDIACFRTSWSDPDAMFVGFKGGDNRASHGHLDLGSFVLDALGQRWGLDLGPDDYNLPGYFGAQRFDYYRLRSEGHNTLTLDAENQVLSARAPLSGFLTTPERGTATADLTQAYSPVFKSVKRQITLERLPKPRVIVTDSFVGGADKVIRWNFHTRAGVRFTDTGAILEYKGKRMLATIASSGKAKFEVISANPRPPQGQQKDVMNLIINYTVAQEDAKLTVIFEPLPA